jgi:hypothetical protein
MTITALVLYWPCIFIATHAPTVPVWIIRVGLSDKTLHYLAYLVLAFLLWSAIRPYSLVKWRKPAVWLVVLITTAYAMGDELLQGLVGRNPDLKDFYADMGGVFTALAVLTVFRFWPTFLVITGLGFFVLTNITRAELSALLPLPSGLGRLLGYSLFSLLWIRCMAELVPARPPESRWLAGAIAMPAAFLLAVEGFAAIASGGLHYKSIAVSAAGITAAVVFVSITAPAIKSAQRRAEGPA